MAGELKVKIGDAVAPATPAGTEQHRPLIHDVNQAPPQAKPEAKPEAAAKSEAAAKPEAAERKESSDLAARPGDDKVSGSSAASVEHMKAAKAKYEEIKTYMDTNKYPNADATLNINGREVKLNDYVKELKRGIRDELKAATDNADKIPQSVVQQSITANTQERVPIAVKYGVDLLNPSREDVSKSIEVQLALHKNNPAQAAELQHLKDLQKQADDYRKAAELPSVSRMIEAQYMALGYTSDKYGLERGANGKLKVDVTDVQTAAHLVMQAGANREFRNNSTFQSALSRLSENLTDANGAERIAKNLATAANTTDIKGKEEAYKKAVEESDKLGMKTLAALVHDQNFMSQQSPEVQARLTASVNAGNDARLAYTRYLADNGKVDQAEVMMAKIKADDPSAVYKTGPDGKVGYQSEEIRDLDRRMAMGSSAGPDDMIKLVNMLDAKMKNQQLTSTDAGKALSYKDILNGAKPSDVGADQILRAMDELNTKKRQDRQASLKTLTTEKTSTEAEMQRLTGDKTIDELTRQTKQAELQDKLRALDTTLRQVQEGADKQNNREDAVRCLFQMNLDLAQNNKASARASLDRLKQVDPEFYRDQIKEKDKLEDACTETPWYKDWRTYAIGAAFVVGAVVGFGVGGMATGGAVASILCVGGGMIAGGAAGGLAYYGVHKGAEMTGWARKDDPANFWQDFRSGFRVGSTAAGITATIPAFAAAAAARSAAAAAAATAEAAAAKATATTLAAGADAAAVEAAKLTAQAAQVASAEAGKQVVVQGTNAAVGEGSSRVVNTATGAEAVNATLQTTANTSRAVNLLRGTGSFYASYAPVGFTSAVVSEGVNRWEHPETTWQQSLTNVGKDGFTYTTFGGLAAPLPNYKLLQSTKLLPFVPVARNSEVALDALGLFGTQAAGSWLENTHAKLSGSDYLDPVTGRVPAKQYMFGPSDTFANDLNDPFGKSRTVQRLSTQFVLDPTTRAIIPIIGTQKRYDPLSTWQPPGDQTP